MMNNKRQERNTTHGFALVELLVAIGIIVILSVSLLFQQNKFDSSVQITNVAHEIATVIQKAQRYGGSSVVGVSPGVDVRYGIYVERINPKTVILFRDNNNNNIYNSSVDTIVETYTISGKTSITAIYTSGITNRPNASVVFLRPNPEPNTPARIVVENDGQRRTVEISRTGQVQVIQ